MSGRGECSAILTHLQLMKLDVNSLRYLSKEEWRVLGSVELGQRNVRVATLFRHTQTVDDLA